jgi:hypothetical protein
VNLRGQAFDVYRLLIGAIIGLAVLAIIVGVIPYFEQLSVNICKKEVQEAMLRASHVPDGSTVAPVRKCVFEAESSLNSKQLSDFINIPVECVSFKASNSSSFNLISGDKGVYFSNRTEVPVFIKCCPPTPQCTDMKCIVGIGVKPDC